MDVAAETVPSGRHEKVLQGAFDYLRSHKADLTAALTDYTRDPSRFSHIEPEVTYIQTTLQALVRASGFENPPPVPFVAPLPLAKVPTVVETENPAKRDRRRHNPAFDLSLLGALHVSDQLTYDVGLDLLFDVARLMDASCERPSLTAKLNRWKNDNLVTWAKSTKMRLLPNGHASYKDLVRACARPGGGLEQVTGALNQVFGVAPNFDAVLTAR